MVHRPLAFCRGDIGEFAGDLDDKEEKNMRLHAITHMTVALLFGMLISGAAQAADTPTTLAGAKVVSAEDVVKLQSNGAVVIDARVASEYAEAHIKGALSVPYREKSAKVANFDASRDQFNLAKLPTSKAASIVIYCNGPECWKSFKASTAAVKGGYTNIHWYREGFPNWKSKGLPIASVD
jgi:rhodanese-related sulfurtransferase